MKSNGGCCSNRPLFNVHKHFVVPSPRISLCIEKGTTQALAFMFCFALEKLSPVFFSHGRTAFIHNIPCMLCQMPRN